MMMMKLPAAIVACVCAVSVTASWAVMTVDGPGLARFDHSYVTCEAKFPAMRGHRDEAYLSLWRTKPDAEALGQLAQARKSKPYQAERARILQAAKGPAPQASSPIEQQCQALWGEAQRASGKTRP